MPKEHDIRFDEVTNSLLRNGDVKTQGLQIDDIGRNRVMLTPVNTRGARASGYITVPPDSLPQLIGALAEIYVARHPDKTAALRKLMEDAISTVEPGPEDAEAIEAAANFRP